MNAPYPAPNTRGPETRLGVRIVLPDGSKYLFPGGNPESALSLVRLFLTDTDLKHPETRIEFGEAIAGIWATLRLIKAPPTTVTEQAAVPG